MASSTNKKKDQRREARNRLRIEREAQARRARLRGRLLVGGSLVAVLGIAAAAGVYASNSAASSGSSAPAGSADPDAAGKPFVQPANTTGKDGVVIPYGKADAQHTLTVWLDPRCPYCAGVEIGLGRTIKEQADAGEYKVEYRFATFLDSALGGGKGSKRAVNALGAAANEGPEKFMEYLQVLYRNHPEKETDDKYGSTATLLELAAQVPGLRTPAFDGAVKDLTYMPWTEKVGKAFHDEGVKGTPAVFVDGKQITVNTGRGIDSVTPEVFGKLIAENRKG
ncbi:thioredoxin domain-containing protein [Streptomyces sp. NPDC085524]|uniref:thioredoxin domain-containing protein n=1 Tax=Streptomyces sp. NPDC085524 TaxID=3365728 RepID=UPI0037CFF024